MTFVEPGLAKGARVTAVVEERMIIRDGRCLGGWDGADSRQNKEEEEGRNGSEVAEHDGGS